MRTQKQSYESDKFRSDKFLPEIKRILGEFLIAAAPFEEDALRNTDLIVLKLNPYRIACRVRRFEYYNFKNEFTIRASRPSGVKTELDKIAENWGDYFFYAFADRSDNTFSHWIIGDLSKFRIYRSMYVRHHGKEPGELRGNGDGSSMFRSYLWSSIPGFVVARFDRYNL